MLPPPPWVTRLPVVVVNDDMWRELLTLTSFSIITGRHKASVSHHDDAILVSHCVPQPIPTVASPPPVVAPPMPPPPPCLPSAPSIRLKTAGQPTKKTGICVVPAPSISRKDLLSVKLRPIQRCAFSFLWFAKGSTAGHSHLMLLGECSEP